jgi:hypothetical protein
MTLTLTLQIATAFWNVWSHLSEKSFCELLLLRSISSLYAQN